MQWKKYGNVASKISRPDDVSTEFDASAIPVDLKPTEVPSPAIEGNQQGCSAPKKLNSMHSTGSDASPDASDMLYSAPKKPFAATPAQATSSKVPNVNSFSVLGKVQRTENKSAPPVKRTRR